MPRGVYPRRNAKQYKFSPQARANMAAAQQKRYGKVPNPNGSIAKNNAATTSPSVPALRARAAVNKLQQNIDDLVETAAIVVEGLNNSIESIINKYK